MKKSGFVGLEIIWLLGLCSALRAGEQSQVDFDRTVAPLLARRCLDCHSGADPKGKLDLSRKSSALAGGESGAAIVPGKAEESLLWERVSADEMPPKAPLDQK